MSYRLLLIPRELKRQVFFPQDVFSPSFVVEFQNGESDLIPGRDSVIFPSSTLDFVIADGGKLPDEAFPVDFITVGLDQENHATQHILGNGPGRHAPGITDEAKHVLVLFFSQAVVYLIGLLHSNDSAILDI